MNKSFNSVLVLALGGIGALLIAIALIIADDESITYDLAIVYSYILVCAITLAAIGFSIYSIASQPAEAKWMLIGLGGNLAVFLIGFLLASGQDVYDINDKLMASETTSRLVSGGLYTLYIIFGIAIAGLIVTEVKSIFKA
jgi:hypothetical protein